VAYLEPGKRLLITLSYRGDEEPNPVQLHTVHLGKVDRKAGDFHANIICHELYVHELYVAGGDDFTMVLMTHESS
jgi:hypothetical protein